MNAAVLDPVSRSKSDVFSGHKARRACRVRAYVHQPGDLALLAFLVRTLLTRGAM